jgi:hypothetical protein
MGDLDQQHILAVARMHERGSASPAGTWRKAANTTRVPATDPVQALLLRRADDHAGCSEASAQEAELTTIVEAIAAREEERWRLGKVPGGKS